MNRNVTLDDAADQSESSTPRCPSTVHYPLHTHRMCNTATKSHAVNLRRAVPLWLEGHSRGLVLLQTDREMPQWIQQHRQKVTGHHTSPPPPSQTGSRDQSDSDVFMAGLSSVGYLSNSVI